MFISCDSTKLPAENNPECLLGKKNVKSFSSLQADIKQNQRRLVDQLSAVLLGSPGPPTRLLLAHCLALLYRLGDPVPASLLVERCNDIIRTKDDSPSGLPTRL